MCGGKSQMGLKHRWPACQGSWEVVSAKRRSQEKLRPRAAGQPLRHGSQGQEGPGRVAAQARGPLAARATGGTRWRSRARRPTARCLRQAGWNRLARTRRRHGDRLAGSLLDVCGQHATVTLARRARPHWAVRTPHRQRSQVEVAAGMIQLDCSCRSGMKGKACLIASK